MTTSSPVLHLHSSSSIISAPFATAERNAGIVLSRETLLSTVWGYDYMGETNVVDVYIRYLRQKIDEAHDVKTLHTIRGVGYVMKTEDNHV